ncbi:MAG: hypothetical protein NDJ89_14320 [Oligoflexia bacterium]|nr:hypothetical protein [Oligoflexia bacterium]
MIHDRFLNLLSTEAFNFAGLLFTDNQLVTIIPMNQLFTVGSLAYQCPTAVSTADDSGQEKESAIAILTTIAFFHAILLNQSSHKIKGLFFDNRRPGPFDNLIALPSLERLLILILVVLVHFPLANVGEVRQVIADGADCPSPIERVAALSAGSDLWANPGTIESLCRFLKTPGLQIRIENHSDRWHLGLIDDELPWIARVLVITQDRIPTIHKPTQGARVEVHGYALGGLFTLELGEVDHIVDHHLADRRARIELLFDREELSLLLFKLFQESTEVEDIARKARDIGHQDHVDFASTDIPHHPLVGRSTGVLRGIAVIDVGIDDLSPRSLLAISQIDVASHAVLLVLDGAIHDLRLLFGRHPYIRANLMRHHVPPRRAGACSALYGAPEGQSERSDRPGPSDATDLGLHLLKQE